MDADPLPEFTEEFARMLAPDPDDVIEEMDARADREGFPTVGPAVGGWLRLLARAVDAERVFEFGSGFGYSAYWIAPAIPSDGEIVLTEVDEEELDDARDNLERGGFADRARFEPGDAIETIETYDGPFDVVLIDNEKERYAEAFAAVRRKVPVGGVVVADNAMRSHTADPAEVKAIFEGEDVDASETSRGIAGYLATVKGDPDFETAILPVGSGVAVSLRVS